MLYNRFGFSSYKEKTNPGTRRDRSPAERGHMEGTFTQFPPGMLAHPQKLAERWWEHPGGVTQVELMGSRELPHRLHYTFGCECHVARTESHLRAGNSRDTLM